MAVLEDFNRYGEQLEKILLLRTAPLAVKMLVSEEDQPAGTLRPKKDLGMHLALCQAFAMARRRRKSLALFREDHWCWAPLISQGLVEFHEGHATYRDIQKYIGIEDPKRAEEFIRDFPRLEYGRYAGMAVGPLAEAAFEPDLVLIYSNTAQIRSLLWAVKYKTGKLIDSQFDALDSCVFSTIPVLQNGGYRITFPDPGEYERAMAGEDEVIFSIPAGKMEEVMSGLEFIEKRKMGYRHLTMEMRPDYPRPPFYNEFFAMWGLETGEEWQRG